MSTTVALRADHVFQAAQLMPQRFVNEMEINQQTLFAEFRKRKRWFLGIAFTLSVEQAQALWARDEKLQKGLALYKASERFTCLKLMQAAVAAKVTHGPGALMSVSSHDLYVISDIFLDADFLKQLQAQEEHVSQKAA